VSPGFFIGGPDFESEEVIAYELGYRGLPIDNLSLSVTLFFNEYDRLISGGGLVVPQCGT
jgi:iron complex outermembrane receptor protein